MNGTERKIQPEERRRSAEARQFSEDRMQLLDTVREMIDIELERYGVTPGGNPHPESPHPESPHPESPHPESPHPESPPLENPPPEDRGRTPPDPPPRRTLWQRIVSLFTGRPL